MTLHLVRLGVDLRALATYAVAHRLDDDDSGYALHRALRDRFGSAGPQPFRLFADAPRPHLLAYAADAEALGDAAALPSPDALLGAVFPAAPQLQEMPATWRAGARYAFEVRVRPVVRFGKQVRAAREGRDNVGEKDAFLAACDRAGDPAEGAPCVDRAVVYADWLHQRLAGAATLDGVELRLLRRTRVRRSTHGAAGARTRSVQGPDALMAGSLRVDDPAAFADRLARGVGRHAAFGFGMLLLSPPRRGATGAKGAGAAA